MPKSSIKTKTPIRKHALPWELPGAHYIDNEEIDLVTTILKSKSLFRFYGPNLQHAVSQLEEHFKYYIGRKHALAVSSGTAALYIALSAFNVGPGDEVLLPGYLWVSCASAIVRTGAIPRLVDIDETYCMDINDLEKKINNRSKVILYIHMSGAAGDIEKVMQLAQKHKLKVLEDCAQSIGSTIKGKQIGAFGDIAIFSFQLNKNMTSGEGGMMVCDDLNLYKRCFALHDLGYARNKKGRLDITDSHTQLWGIGARMSEVTGAIAFVQLHKLDKIVFAMRNSKHRILKALNKISHLSFRKIIDPSGDSGAFLIVMLPSEEICRYFVKRLKEEGIDGPTGSVACVVLGDVDFYWYYNTPSLVNKRSNSHDNFPWSHPANQFSSQISYEKGTLKNCDQLAPRSLKLAIASNLTKNDEMDIVNAFNKIAAELWG